MPQDYFLKVRGSIAQVGNDTGAYTLENVYTPGTLGSFTTAQTSNTYPLADLKPEKTTSWELGFDYRMFNNRLGIDSPTISPPQPIRFFQCRSLVHPVMEIKR